MIQCTKDRHRFTYRGRSDNGKSYRFRCITCQTRVVVYRNSFWRSARKRALWIDRHFTNALEAS